MSGGLGGTGRLADDLWLMAHHESSGRPFLGPRPLGVGLAGGLLAELVLGGWVFAGFDGAVVASRDARPAGGLARQVRDQVAAEAGRHGLPDWLLFLSRGAAGGVAARLERAGYLRRAGGRVPWRGPRWVPVDPDWAFAALLRARPGAGGQVPAHAVVLAGLAIGCGLRFRLDQYLPGAGHAAGQAARRLIPDLQKLIAAVQQTVDRSVLAQRM